MDGSLPVDTFLLEESASATKPNGRSSFFLAVVISGLHLQRLTAIGLVAKFAETTCNNNDNHNSCQN
jgi:hypothetical protein